MDTLQNLSFHIIGLRPLECANSGLLSKIRTFSGPRLEVFLTLSRYQTSKGLLETSVFVCGRVLELFEVTKLSLAGLLYTRGDGAEGPGSPSLDSNVQMDPLQNFTSWDLGSRPL